MMDTLLIITSAFQATLLKDALVSMRDKIDVLVIVDGPAGKIKGICKEHKAELIVKESAKGLIDSWNIGYRFFVEKKYKNCILSNDDVRFARGFSDGLIKGLVLFDLVGPLTNEPGHQHRQHVNEFTENTPDAMGVDQIQQILITKFRISPFEEINYINGFCFAFKNTINKFAFDKQNLFNPKLINVGGEDELCQRARNDKGRVAISRISYLWHLKRASFPPCHFGADAEKPWTKLFYQSRSCS